VWGGRGGWWEVGGSYVGSVSGSGNWGSVCVGWCLGCGVGGVCVGGVEICGGGGVRLFWSGRLWSCGGVGGVRELGVMARWGKGWLGGWDFSEGGWGCVLWLASVMWLVACGSGWGSVLGACGWSGVGGSICVFLLRIWGSRAVGL